MQHVLWRINETQSDVDHRRYPVYPGRAFNWC
jgi:hypothetical protein